MESYVLWRWLLLFIFLRLAASIKVAKPRPSVTINSTDGQIRALIKDWACALPNSNPKYLLSKRWIFVGKAEQLTQAWLNNTKTAGLGNYLLFYPALYWYAAFTGRGVALSDGMMTQMCSLVGCGFPLQQALNPGVYNRAARPRDVFRVDLLNHLSGDAKLVSEPNLFGSHFTLASDFWLRFGFATRCVSRLSGCVLGDVSCAERFAYQQLIQGPFRQVSSDVYSRLRGLDNSSARRLLESRRAVLSSGGFRFTAAFHLRCEFGHFENASLNTPEFERSVHAWLDGDGINSEAKLIFGEFVDRLLFHLNSPARSSSEPTMIFLAADNNLVKRALARTLTTAAAALNSSSKPSSIVFLDSPHSLQHSRVRVIQGRDGALEHTSPVALFDTVLDWYCLGLSDHIYGWRARGGLGSTYVSSAARVSGDLNRTQPTLPVGAGNGMGTLKFQLQKKKTYPHSYHWQQESSYSF